MTGFEHLLTSFDVGDLLDDVASSDPPAYLRRCFAEGISTPALSLPRVQQLAVCGMVLDSILNGRDYAAFEPDLIADWRVHYVQHCGRMRDMAVAALNRALGYLEPVNPDAAAELAQLQQRLAPA